MSGLTASERNSTTIVLLGSFNPRIFQPAWFSAQGLIAPDEGSEANISFINNDICRFEAEWFYVEVIAERFTVGSRVTPFVDALRDLVAGTFRILNHTPIQRMGFNSSAHFAIPSAEAWHEFGHTLAPKAQLWEPVLEKPGTRTVVIEGARPDGHEGHVQVRVEPSQLMENSIFIEVNDEFRKSTATSAEWVIEILNGGEWQASLDRAKAIREQLMSAALSGGTT